MYGSRQAWFLPSIFTVSRESLDWLIRKGQSNAPVDLLNKLEINSQEIEELLKQYSFNNQNLTDWFKL